MIHEQFRAYRATLQDDRRHLLERFEVVDVARKVVGVGSVGTRAFIVLLQGRDQQDPLFLQVKEATASVLEDHLPKSRYRQPGERVVQGQRMMQAASDIFLGWTKGVAGEPLPVLAPAARHEGLGRRRNDAARKPRVLRAHLRPDPGACPRPLRRPDRARCVPRQERPLRPSRSPTSPNATPTRTSGTTERSPTRSAPADSRHSKASETDQADVARPNSDARHVARDSGLLRPPWPIGCAFGSKRTSQSTEGAIVGKVGS